MTQSCIIRCHSGQLHCIYTNNGNIYIRSLTATNWSNAHLIGTGIKNTFTVARSDEDDIRILYQQKDGSICLACQKNKWQPKVILHSHNSDNPDIIIHCIINKRKMKLLYNLPRQKNQYLTVQYQQNDSLWSRPTELDNFVPFADKSFRILQKNTGEYILIYQKKAPETQIICRSINGEKIGEPVCIYATGYTLCDYSVLVKDDILHAVFIILTSFGKELVYTSLERGKGTRPVVISEGRGINHPIISFANGKLYVWWIACKRLYYSISYDKGVSFSKCEVYKKHFTDTPIKAQYIDEYGKDSKDYAFSDMYVRENMPWDIQLTDDIYNDFFSIDPPETDNNGIERLKSDLNSMKIKIAEYSAKITERDENIHRLNRLLKMKNEELLNAERKMKRGGIKCIPQNNTEDN